MAKASAKKTSRVVGLTFTGIAGVFLYACGSALGNDTFVNLWWVAAAVGVLSLVSGVTLHRVWRGLTGTGNVYVNYLLHLFVVGAVLFSSFLFCNYYFAYDGSMHKENVVVELRYKEKHYHTRRITRRTYARGAPYYVYKVQARFADGCTKNLTVREERYRRISVGDTMSVNVSNGLFGFPVIKGTLSKE